LRRASENAKYFVTGLTGIWLPVIHQLADVDRHVRRADLEMIGNPAAARTAIEARHCHRHRKLVGGKPERLCGEATQGLHHRFCGIGNTDSPKFQLTPL
jgi:hypothetical protein